MQGRELSDRGPMRVRDATNSPRIQALRAKLERLPDQLGTEVFDQGIVGVECGSHAPLYQRCVYTARGQTFIGLADALLHKLRVAQDPKFGLRLRDAIARAKYKSSRQFAIEGMGWTAETGPQRLNNYLKGRIPEVETLIAMADKLNESVSDLLGLRDPSSASEAGLRDTLRHLLELAGIEPEQADTIANVSLAAQRLYQAFPEEEPAPTRAKYAARAAWLQQHSPTPST